MPRWSFHVDDFALLNMHSHSADIAGTARASKAQRWSGGKSDLASSHHLMGLKVFRLLTGWYLDCVYKNWRRWVKWKEKARWPLRQATAGAWGKSLPSPGPGPWARACGSNNCDHSAPSSDLTRAYSRTSRNKASTINLTILRKGPRLPSTFSITLRALWPRLSSALSASPYGFPAQLLSKLQQLAVR